jgi:hypothetical protein
MLDAERNSRFLYPPVFFMAAIGSALYSETTRWLGDLVPNLSTDVWSRLAVATSAGGVMAIAAGFVIGSISISSCARSVNTKNYHHTKQS